MSTQFTTQNGGLTGTINAYATERGPRYRLVIERAGVHAFSADGFDTLTEAQDALAVLMSDLALQPVGASSLATEEPA